MNDTADTKYAEARAKLANAKAICDEHNDNLHDSGVTPDQLADHKYAVIIKRDNDSWVHCANTMRDIADEHMTCVNAEYYSEWIDQVLDVATGEPVPVALAVKTTATLMENGTQGSALDRPAGEPSQAALLGFQPEAHETAADVLGTYLRKGFHFEVFPYEGDSFGAEGVDVIVGEDGSYKAVFKRWDDELGRGAGEPIALDIYTELDRVEIT